MAGGTQLGLQSGSQRTELLPDAADADSPESTRGFVLALQHLVVAKDRLSRDFEGLVTTINSTLSVLRRWEDNWDRKLPQLLKNAISSKGNSSVSGEEAGAIFS